MNCNKTKVIGCEAGILNMCLDKGNSFFEEIKWVKQINGKNVPVNLRGYSAKLEVISAHNTKNEKVLELVSPIGISLDNNKIFINIHYQASDNFNWSKGNYRLIMTSPLGKKTTILKGKFIIAGSVNCCK